jgi:hypothetical protein
MKTKILELLKGMTSDSKKESYKCEKELCEILTVICNKLETIEDSVGYRIRFYPDKITGIDSDNAYTGMKKLPEIIYCNYENFEFEFETEWLDIDYKSYFEDLKRKSIDVKTKTIENVEFSLNKHKEELESLKNLTYETLDGKR